MRNLFFSDRITVENISEGHEPLDNVNEREKLIKKHIMTNDFGISFHYDCIHCNNSFHAENFLAAGEILPS